MYGKPGHISYDSLHNNKNKHSQNIQNNIQNNNANDEDGRKKSVNQVSNINCQHCGGKGHTIRDCKVKIVAELAKKKFNAKVKKTNSATNCIQNRKENVRIFYALNSDIEFVLDS